MNEQQAENHNLRQEISTAGSSFIESSQTSQSTLHQAMEEERLRASAEREQLLLQIGSLIKSSADAQERRMSEHLSNANKRVKTSEDDYSYAHQRFDAGMTNWTTKSQSLIESCIRSRENVKAKIKADWSVANERTSGIKKTTEAVHEETTQIVDKQMAHMDTQLTALDEIISRVRTQNEQHHTAHTNSLAQLSSDVQKSYISVGNHMSTSYARTQALDVDMRDRSSVLLDTLPSLAVEGKIRRTLASLRDDIAGSDLVEYVPTGQTPLKTVYTYPNKLPRTSAHDALLERMRSSSNPDERRSPCKPNSSPRKIHSSPTKGVVFNDDPSPVQPIPFSGLTQSASAPLSRSATTSSLREIDINITATPAIAITADQESDVKTVPPSLKRSNTSSVPTVQQVESKLPMKRPTRMTVAGYAGGRENDPSANLGASVGPRPARRLRSRGSD